MHSGPHEQRVRLNLLTWPAVPERWPGAPSSGRTGGRPPRPLGPAITCLARQRPVLRGWPKFSARTSDRPSCKAEVAVSRGRLLLVLAGSCPLRSRAYSANLAGRFDPALTG